MLVYLDTSALAKWYLNEPGSEPFSEWIQQQDDVHISSLTAIEFRCLLARRERRNEISATLEPQLYAAFQADINASHLIHHGVNDTDIAKATHLIPRVKPIALRTLDAIHLSTAERIGAAAVATADRVMLEAAEYLDLRTYDFRY